MVIAKAWAGFAGAIITALIAALSDDVLDINDTQQIIVTALSAGATMYAVYRTRNSSADTVV